MKINNATMYYENKWQEVDLTIEDGILTAIGPTKNENCDWDAEGLYAFPGFIDIHVHLREPGFKQKESILSGTKAAAKGGFTIVCSMPNLSPTPDSLDHLNLQRKIIEEDALIHVLPYGTITKGELGQELSDMEDLAPYVFAFTDDGKGVSNKYLMKEAMLLAKKLGKTIVSHAEDESLVQGGVIHDGDFARKHHLPGNPSESEWKQVEREIALAKETGCPYHVCHVSSKESIELVRQAQKDGLNVSCETTPHYLLLDDSKLKDEGRFKMNPPIRSIEDQEALIEALLDGTILCLATDHAPHTEEEKSKGLLHSANGIVGLETAFPLIYTYFVRNGKMSLEKLIDLMTNNVRKRFNLPLVEVGQAFDMTFFDLEKEYWIDPNKFLSQGKATPFQGWKVYGECIKTFVSGKEVLW